jgi:hypothetical protein
MEFNFQQSNWASALLHLGYLQRFPNTAPAGTDRKTFDVELMRCSTRYRRFIMKENQIG